MQAHNFHCFVDKRFKWVSSRFEGNRTISLTHVNAAQVKCRRLLNCVLVGVRYHGVVQLICKEQRKTTLRAIMNESQRVRYIYGKRRRYAKQVWIAIIQRARDRPLR